jgi:hypothetical protein
MLPKYVYTAMVDVPASLASRRADKLRGPPSATSLAAASINVVRLSGFRRRGLTLDRIAWPGYRL